MNFKLLPVSREGTLRCTLLAIYLGAAIASFAQHNTGTPQYAYFDNSVWEYKMPFANTDATVDRLQMIYRPGNITVMNGTTAAPSGKITKVYLRTKPGTAKVFNMTSVVIKLAQTTDTVYPNKLDVPFYTCTEVFNKAAYTVSSPGWIEFELSAPFNYDKAKSLVLEISGDNGFSGTYKSRSLSVMAGKLNESTGHLSGLHNLNEFGFDYYPTDVNDVTIGNGAILYPNPASERITLNVPGHTNGQLIITDLNGRIVLQQQFTGDNQQFSVASLNNGLYFYKAISNDNTLIGTGKLTIFH